MTSNDKPSKEASVLAPADMEADLARSAWHDKAFAVWFAPFAKRAVLLNGARGEAFFRECGDFAKAHKAAPAEVGDDAGSVLKSPAAQQWFRALVPTFPALPGGRLHKPTSWQMEKARKYLASRHNTLLAEQLNDAEQQRATDPARADLLAAEARKLFTSFSDAASCCRRAMDDIDGLLGLAESNPPLFTIDGEAGRMLNSRLKPDNLGIFLADQKLGKTTDLVGLAVEAGRVVPTLLISAGDERQIKVDARIATHLAFMASQPEYAGKVAVPVPDCMHNAAGTCPLGLSGAPRQTKDWKVLIEDGATAMQLAEGEADGSLSIEKQLYKPCCRCFPRNDGTSDDHRRRKTWKSGVWFRTLDIPLFDKQTLTETRARYETQSIGGGLRTAAYAAGELTIDGIYELLDTLDRTENFVPRVIVLDYADLLKQEMGRDTDKDHDGMRRIWEGLRGITSKLDLLLLTATQTNGLSDGVETITRKMCGRSKKAIDNCTWIVSLNQTLRERRAKVKRMSMMAAREGEYDPEQQALCCQWNCVQDGFAFSMPIFCKIKNETQRERD